jgi:FtsP/CotA-like multicopper oxidase with cupredoxin domain
VHWHGLRLENRYDGVPHQTQAPIPVGGEFTSRIQLPDAGLYWYHPTSGRTTPRSWACTAPSWSSPTEADYWSPVDREVVLTLDDLLVEEGRIAPAMRPWPLRQRLLDQRGAGSPTRSWRRGRGRWCGCG